MTFANPLGLLWGLLAVPVVILYLRRIRARREPVATGMIWEQVLAQQQTRSAWQPWRHGVSLAVQLTILFLLVLALAEPVFPGPRHVVLVVDNSAGMNATNVEPSRLGQAKQAALCLVDGLRDCDRMAVLTTGDAVGVRCTLTNIPSVLQEAIQGIPATRGPTCVDAAVALGRRMLLDQPQVEIIVLGDGGFDGASELDADDRESRWFGLPPWVCLALLGVVLLAGEWCFYQRRWIT